MPRKIYNLNLKRPSRRSRLSMQCSTLSREYRVDPVIGCDLASGWNLSHAVSSDLRSGVYRRSGPPTR